MQKKDVLALNISRYDKYIASADTKANIIIGLIGVNVGAIIVQADEFMKKLTETEKPGYIVGLMIIAIISFGVSAFFSLKTIIPRTPEPQYDSVFYFESVKSYPVDKYRRLLNRNDFTDDLIKQSSELAAICSKKMKNVRYAMISLVIGVAITLIAILLSYR